MRRRVLNLCRTLVLTLVTCACLAAQTPIAIRTAQAKARQNPSSNAKILATVHHGEVFVVINDQPYWYGITLKDGRTAYVPKSVCTVLPAEEPNEGSAESPGVGSSPGSNLPSGTDIPGCTSSSVPADWAICPPAGSGGIYAAAYVEKNRLAVPCSYAPVSVQQVLSLPALPANVRALPSGDQSLKELQALESKSVLLEGYFAMAKDGGKEGTNCGSGTRTDIHMEIVATDAEDPKTNRNQHVITEVTPWFHDAISAWTKENIGKYAAYLDGYKGNMLRQPTKVRIYGWLFYDEAHVGDGSVGKWRGTSWEIHPITRIEVFENGAWKIIQ